MQVTVNFTAIAQFLPAVVWALLMCVAVVWPVLMMFSMAFERGGHTSMTGTFVFSGALGIFSMLMLIIR